MPLPSERVAKFLGTKENDFQKCEVSIKDVEQAEVQDAARFVIRELGGFLPSVEIMKRETDPSYVDSVTAINNRIRDLKTSYSNIITTLIRYYVQNISDEALDRYMQVDDLKYYNDEDASERTSDPMWGPHYYDTLEVFFRSNERYRYMELRSELCDVRSDYANQLVVLYKKRSLASKRQRDIEAKQLLSNFPKTSQELLEIDESQKDVQLTFAKFLAADNTRRDGMATQYGWKFQDTRTLINFYEENQQFRLVIERLVAPSDGFPSRDPRQRR